MGARRLSRNIDYYTVKPHTLSSSGSFGEDPGKDFKDVELCMYFCHIVTPLSLLDLSTHGLKCSFEGGWEEDCPIFSCVVTGLYKLSYFLHFLHFLYFLTISLPYPLHPMQKFFAILRLTGRFPITQIKMGVLDESAIPWTVYVYSLWIMVLSRQISHYHTLGNASYYSDSLTSWNADLFLATWSIWKGQSEQSTPLETRLRMSSPFQRHPRIQMTLWIGLQHGRGCQQLLRACTHLWLASHRLPSTVFWNLLLLIRVWLYLT